MPFWCGIRCKTLLENYGCGCVSAVPDFCNFEPQIWPEIITSRDAESTCFKGSRTSCDVILFGIFWPSFGRKRSHHVMDASCRWQYNSNLFRSTPPICNAVPCWLLSFGERETPQYTSNFYCSMPPICTAVRLPLCTGDTFEKILGVGGSGKFLILAGQRHHITRCRVCSLFERLDLSAD